MRTTFSKQLEVPIFSNLKLDRKFMNLINCQCCVTVKMKLGYTEQI